MMVEGAIHAPENYKYKSHLSVNPVSYNNDCIDKITTDKIEVQM